MVSLLKLLTNLLKYLAKNWKNILLIIVGGFGGFTASKSIDQLLGTLIKYSWLIAVILILLALPSLFKYMTARTQLKIEREKRKVHHDNKNIEEESSNGNKI